MNYHKKISYQKSIFRIIGLLFLVGGYIYFQIGIVLLIVAEVLGIMEEKDENRENE